MVRPPVVAGQFYENDPSLLKKQVEGCFLSKFGPGSLPHKNKGGHLRAVIVPHAGLVYSGACAAHAYKEIVESGPFDAYLFLGVMHTTMGGTSVMSEDWKTPLGIATIDRELVSKIVAETAIPHNDYSHRYEHSIEVQLPFLQHLAIPAPFVPITIAYEYDAIELAKKLAEVIKNSSKKICILASSDLTHYGKRYGYVPFHDNVKEKLYALDQKAIGFITKLDAHGFGGFLENSGATICGKHPIMVLIHLLKELGIKNSQLYSYYTSGDVTGDWENVVGYASLKFW